jgi:hypothetical protein
MRLQLWRYFLVVMMLTSCPHAFGQAATPTSQVITRTFRVGSQLTGTIFSIDVDGREYWVTAKHILTGKSRPPWGSISDKTTTVRILTPTSDGAESIQHTFSVIDPGNDVDEVVLAASKPLLDSPLPSAGTSYEGVLFGGECSFLGYPLGHSWLGAVPFVKHCFVSALPDRNAPQRVWYLDGVNNNGFSGGPVLYRTGTDQIIIGVVSGFWTEQRDPTALDSDALIPGSPGNQVYQNPGFIIAYDIAYATDAIKAHPIGPLRPKK